MTISHGREQIEYGSRAADGQLKSNDLAAVAAFVRLWLALSLRWYNRGHRL